MSELIHKNDSRATIRWKLLTSASALALATYVSSAELAEAGNSERPLVWLEVDGQFAQQDTDIEIYNPSFLAASPFDAMSHLDREKAPPTIWDKGARLSFQPEGSDWILSLGVRYGKSARREVRDGHPTTASITKYNYHTNGYYPYQHFEAQSSEGHAILDFQVGKDVGLGRLGSGGNSIFSAGLRIAQFTARNHVGIKSEPVNGTLFNDYDKFYASFAAKRRFKGIGPSLSWDASATIAGNQTDGSITFDWGVNGAVLFGRQKTDTQLRTTDMHFHHYNHYAPAYQDSASTTRSKNITMPNLGGFAGVSWRASNAKVSFGYRADMFFGAIDGGIDSAKKENRGFYGPFASISIGLGD